MSDWSDWTPDQWYSWAMTKETAMPALSAYEYRLALAALGLSQKAAGRWLMVSEKTAHNYASKGPSGPAQRAILMALKHGLTK